MRSTHDEVLGRLAQAAQILDQAGLYKDANLVDQFLKHAAAESDMMKVAGMWASFVSRLGGWARQLLFREYRALYQRAKEAQQALAQEIAEHRALVENWATKEKELRGALKRHNLQEWRGDMAGLLSEMRISPERVIQPYDEQHGNMMAQVLKIAPQELPQRNVPESLSGATVQPPTAPVGEGVAPEESVEAPPAETAGAAAPPAASPEAEAPIAPGPEAEVPKAPEAPEASETPEAPEATKPEMPAPPEGWREERFGRSRKHGWEWQWQVSEDNDRIRLPKVQLAAAATGQGKILHRRDDLYRPTYGTASLKLKSLMGDNYWRAESDPTDPSMAILLRTEETVEPPLGMRPAPVQQAEKLRKLRGESVARMWRIADIAEAVANKTDEERLADTAAGMIGRLEAEEIQQ